MRVSKHKLEDHEVEAFIFDVDGTLVNTMPLYFKSWALTCRQFELEMTEFKFYSLAGVPLPEIVTHLHLEQKQSPPTEDFIQAFIKVKNENHLKLKEEHDIYHTHKEKHDTVKIAAASSGQKHHVHSHLKGANIHHLFEEETHIVVNEELPPGRGKPEPDIFLEAAKRLGVDPTKCRAFEDGESGIKAAIAAGMEVFDVREFEAYPRTEGLVKALDILKQQRSDWM
eukprot:maker-scaffold_15-snap-gene-10.76-mRNA-1 protein AED:0.00 eAED:0.00 QI:37/1/1/1/0/0/2/85/225